jgi:hypothetical protein
MVGMRRAWLWVIVTLLLVQPVGGVVIWLAKGDPVAFLALVPTWLLLLLELGYRYSERIHMLVERARLFVLGGGAIWGARAEYDGERVDNAELRLLADILLAKDKKGATVAREPNKFVLQVLGLTISIAIHTIVAGPENESKRTLVVEVLPHEWPLRRAIDLATGLVPMLFDEISHKVSSANAKYSAELRFPAGNPYFGFFIKNLSLSNIDRFIVDVNVTVPGDPRPARVTADKDRLVVVANRSTTLSRVSQRFLSLSLAGT